MAEQPSECAALAEENRDFPLINQFLFIASQSLPDKSLPGLAADAAYAIWSDRLGPEDAKKYGAAAFEYWEESKYRKDIDFNFPRIDARAKEKAEQLARELLGDRSNA